MKYKKAIISIALLLLGLGGVYAQESPTATGGEAIGTGGSVCYSIGQVVYTTASGTNGSVAQGVQQPYEISTTVGINEATINLELSVFPNPTTNYLTLSVDNNSNLNYQLIGLQGKIIANKKVNSGTTTINVESLAPATYFLKVTKANQVVKAFKIVKN